MRKLFECKPFRFDDKAKPAAASAGADADVEDPG